MMKIRSCICRSHLIAMVISVVPFLSCSTAKDLTAFDVNCNLPRIYFNYPPKSPGNAEATIYTGKVKIPLDSILTANHVPSGFISSAYLSRLAMVITDPAEATFNWVESVRMIGSADSTFLQLTELGSDTAIYPDSKSVDLALKKVNLKPIILKDSYFFKVLATLTGQVPASSIRIYLDSQIKLHIEPL